MLIDWFTVVAEIVNFLVLVALLKRFLWERLVAAIDEREKRIAGRLADAEEKNKEAEKLNEQARAEEAALDDKHDQIIRQAQREGEDERSAMIQRARDEVRGLEARWHEDLKREQSAFLNHLKRRAATEMLTVIRRALADLAGADVQECAIRTFLNKIKELDTAALRDLLGKELTVLSPLEIPGPEQHEIQAVLEERLGAPVPLQFQRAPAMAWGIELREYGIVNFVGQGIARVRSKRVVLCIHSVSAPLATAQADVAWPCNKEKYIVHFPVYVRARSRKPNEDALASCHAQNHRLAAQ